LLLRPRVPEVIHSSELEQDIEAAYEGSSSRGARVGVHSDSVGLWPRLCL